jgi:heme-degrading monooxygenase HmoA
MDADMPKVGFSVIYRWRVAADQEAAFIAAWRRITELVMERRGGLGSRLHRAADGTFVAYAQWPSEEAWRAAGERGKTEVLDEAAQSIMRQAIVERIEEVRLEPVADMLMKIDCVE